MNLGPIDFSLMFKAVEYEKDTLRGQRETLRKNKDKVFQDRKKIDHQKRELGKRERERKRDTDKCILFIFRLGSNPRYLVTLHTVLPLKH